MSKKELFPIVQVANVIENPVIKSLFKLDKKTKLLDKTKKIKFCGIKRLLVLAVSKYNGCTNGIKWLVTFTGMGYTSINEHLLELEANGVFNTLRRNNSRGRGKNFYEINMDNLKSYFMLDEPVDNSCIEELVTPDSGVSFPGIRGQLPRIPGNYKEENNLLKKSLNKKHCNKGGKSVDNVTKFKKITEPKSTDAQNRQFIKLSLEMYEKDPSKLPSEYLQLLKNQHSIRANE